MWLELAFVVLFLCNADVVCVLAKLAPPILMNPTSTHVVSNLKIDDLCLRWEETEYLIND